MKREQRLRKLEGKNQSEAAELIRDRLRELGIGEPDPFDIGNQVLVETILREIENEPVATVGEAGAKH